MKKYIIKHRRLHNIVKMIYFTCTQYFQRSFDSGQYWENRYSKGGNSGSGSYRKLAIFKAQTVNQFVIDRHIKKVIEFGCGDGNQLSLANYPNYVGIDVSFTAVQKCKYLYQNDINKSFKHLQDYDGESADLALSLDVIYHLVEDDIFEAYMERLFFSSKRYVIIYSSNTEEQDRYQSKHVRHRDFLKITEKNKAWELMDVIKNPFPDNGNNLETSLADFYIFRRKPNTNDV